jgi:hypothetical protein
MMDTAAFLDRRAKLQQAEAALAECVARLAREGKPLDGDAAVEYRVAEYQAARDVYDAA